MPLTVVLTPGDVSLEVRSRFGHGPAHTFVVDTGSSQSVVARSLAKSAHLASTDVAQRQPTVCSIITDAVGAQRAMVDPGGAASTPNCSVR